MGNLKAQLKQHQTPLREFVKQCGFACAIAAMMSLGLLCAFAAIRVNVNLPFAVHQPVTTAITAISTGVGAFLIAKSRKRNGMMLGACVGLVMFIVLAALSAVIVQQPASAQLFIKLIAMLCAGGLGGIFGVSKAAKTKKIKV